MTGVKNLQTDNCGNREPATQPVPPAGYAPCSPELLESGVDCATAPRWSSQTRDGHSHWHPVPPAGGEPEVLATVNKHGDLMRKGVLRSVELVDRAHVTRMLAEVETLRAELDALKAKPQGEPEAWLYKNTSMGNELSFQRLDHYYPPYIPNGEHDYVKGIALYASPPAPVADAWQKLDKPAKVGAVRFQAGVSSRLVVEAAQRRYVYDVTPENEALRIAKVADLVDQLHAPVAVVLPDGYMIVERSIWTEEQAESAAKCITMLKNVPGMTDRDLALAAMDAGQCHAPEIALADLACLDKVKELNHSQPICVGDLDPAQRLAMARGKTK